MPKRSLTSRVLRWPDATKVISAAGQWAIALAQTRNDICGIGYIGSYARGDWGVGSDLDLVIVVESSSEPFHQRAVQFNALDLPVPVDLLVYTSAEWKALISESTRFSAVLKNELRWLTAATAKPDLN